MSALERAARLAIMERELALERELARRREADPLRHMRWLPGQLAFLRSTRKKKLFRAGNQSQGKTIAGAAEVLFRAMGAHPFKAVRPAPTRQWVICATNEQSEIVQRKLWELTPKDLVAPGCRFDERKGAFLGKYPTLRLRNGSWVKFKSGGGDPANIASDTLHHILFDEPPESQRVYNEALKRLLWFNGDLSMTFTPVNRPVDYIRKMCEDGQIEDLHFRLEPQNLIFDDGEPMRLGDGSPKDARWIEDRIAETSDIEVPVAIHGEWEFRREGAYFAKVWHRESMIRPAPPGNYKEHLGIDFGSRPGAQIGLYLLIDPRGGVAGNPRVHVADEYVAEDGTETNEDDARGILALLRRNESQWSQLDGVKSDRSHNSGRSDEKSAFHLMVALARELGLKYRQLQPQVVVAKRGEGRGNKSRSTRWRWVHQQMARGNFSVDPRCEVLIDALSKARPDSDDDYKHPIDALVYGVDDYTFGDPHEDRAPVAMWG